MKATEEGALGLAFLVYNQVGKGTYWRAFHLARALVARGHSVSLVATAPQARWGLRERAIDGVRLIEAPDLLSGSLRSGWDLWDSLHRHLWLRGECPDLVHAFEARPVVLLPGLAAQARSARLVMDWCDWFGRGGSVEERPNRLVRAILRPVETWFEEDFRARADGTTVINSVLWAKARALGVPEERMFLLPNGADLEGIRPLDRSAVRQRLGVPQDALVVAYTGALFQRDGRLMAAAFDRILRMEPRARLLLIGYCNLDIERWVADSAAVWRTGPVPPEDLAAYLSASDAGWLPLCDTGANRGRFPMKLADYMAAGLPVVATDVGDAGRLIREQGFGCVTAPNPEAMAEAVVALLSTPQERAAQGRLARAAAEELFAWPQIAEGLEKHYRKIMSMS